MTDASRVAQAATRFGKRRRNSFRRRVYLIVGGVFAVIALAVVGWVVGFSNVLTLRDVVVQGGDPVTGEMVRQAAQAPMGKPLVWVDTRAIADRVARVTRVEKADVQRTWPNTLTIIVAERTALFGVWTREGQYQLVDKSGVIFRGAVELPQGVPAVEVDLSNGRLLTDVATILTGLPQQVRDELTGLQATSPDHIVLHLTGGRDVFWGASSDNAFKAQVLVALLSVKASYYDISAPSHPATR